MSSHSEAFELRYDFTGVGEEEYDAVLVTFDGWEDLRLLSVPPNLEELPNEVWFWASLDRVRSRDFLLADVRWTVCSNRMLDALRRLGDFPHVAIPAHFREARDGLDETLEDEYSVLVITEAIEALDLSRAEVLRREDGSIARVRKWEFKVPPAGFPPVFRPKERRTVLLVSPVAKAALEAGEFKGMVFKPKTQIAMP